MAATEDGEADATALARAPRQGVSSPSAAGTPRSRSAQETPRARLLTSGNVEIFATLTQQAVAGRQRRGNPRREGFSRLTRPFVRDRDEHRRRRATRGRRRIGPGPARDLPKRPHAPLQAREPNADGAPHGGSGWRRPSRCLPGSVSCGFGLITRGEGHARDVLSLFGRDSPSTLAQCRWSISPGFSPAI